MNRASIVGAMNRASIVGGLIAVCLSAGAARPGRYRLVAQSSGLVC